MALIGMKDVSWGFGGTPLIDGVTFHIERGQRVCLLGRNGAGKSSLFKLLQGKMSPDGGEIWRQQGVTVAELAQDVPAEFDGTVFDVVAGGLGEKGDIIAKFRRLNQKEASDGRSDPDVRQATLQHQIEADGAWETQRHVESLLTRMQLAPDARFATLSAGMKRRVLFARAMAKDPDVLLLDEPTNHLDVAAIEWMEDFVLKNVKTLWFITHDRAFLKKVANRIMELDRGRLVAYDCDYGTYLERRQAAMEAKEKQRSEFDKKLAKEETWIRQGLKARRKRNEGRVRALEKMREARRARRNEVGNVNLQVQQAEKTGKLVMEARSIRAAVYGSADGSQGRTPLVSDFSTVIMRGDRVGIIGPNGAGKTTLLQILLNQAAPDDGHVRHGHGLRVAYFDQLRAGLDENRTVSENIGEGNDFIVFNGEKRHVISYLKDFLFTPERCRTPVHILSGGEKNRLLLARLFTRPANVLVMDEPTNDLDIETLELLEDMLFHFQGTVLVVSHDRAFLNNVVTSTIVFEGQGEVIEYAGGYDDWLIQRAKRQKDMPAEKKEKPAAKPAPSEKPRGNRPPKLGFKEKRELDALPAKIEEMEAEYDALYAQMGEPEFYKTDKDEIARVKARMEELEKAIEYAYDRWEALERGV